jgi:hypothetical protein
VKNPKLPVTTAYFMRDGEVKRLYSSDPVRALMLCTGHMAMDHYLADVAHVYDSHTAELYWEITRTQTGAETTYKCDPSKLDDPMRKKRRSVAYLL